MVTRRTLLISGVSAAALGAAAYGFWPRLDAYQEEVERQRRLLSADPARQDFLRLATLAANGHNTQPWRFRITEYGVRILPDFARRTEIADPDDHHLFVSLGCATENLVIAAKAHGRAARVQIQGNPETIIDVALPPGPAKRGPLYQAIPRRQSTRSVYEGRPLSTADIDQLKAAARQDGVSVLIFTDAADREAILEFVVAGNSAQMDNPAFVAELRRWLRFSPARALETKDGLFAASTGNPVAPEWLGGAMFDAFFTKDAENDKYRAQLRSSAGVAVFVGDREDPEHWIKVGRSFQRFALQATALGVRSAHVNQPIEIPALRAEFSRWLGAPKARPDLVVRFGRAPTLPMSLRRPVSALLV